MKRRRKNKEIGLIECVKRRKKAIKQNLYKRTILTLHTHVYRKQLFKTIKLVVFRAEK